MLVQMGEGRKEREKGREREREKEREGCTCMKGSGERVLVYRFDRWCA